MRRTFKSLYQQIGKLEESEIFYRHLVEFTPEAIVIHSEGKIVFVNPAALKLIGAKKEREVIGESVMKFIHPDSIPMIEERIKKMLSKQKVAPYAEEKFISLNGEILYAETKAVPFIIHGKPAILAILHDITQRKRAENDLAHLASLVESSSDAIWSRTLDRKMLSWNKGAEKLYGYKAKEVIGKSIDYLVIPDDRSKELDDITSKVLHGKQIQSFETVRISKDRNKFDVSMTISPLKDAQGNIIGISAIVRNISEQKEQEKLKDEFISMASHELKTPITSMKMFLDLLEHSLNQAHKEGDIVFVKRIKEQANRIRDLVNDLLDISRIRAGKLRFNVEAFQLEDLLKDTIEAIQPAAKKHRLIYKDSISLPISADKFRIYQVVTNLINNAIKYSPHGDKIYISSTRSRGNAVVSVKDFGIGIAKDKQQKIFEKLYQVTDPQVKTFPGLGMGLYISSEIIKRHKGEMWVKSLKGKGATFFFSLPLK